MNRRVRLPILRPLRLELEGHLAKWTRPLDADARRDFFGRQISRPWVEQSERYNGHRPFWDRWEAPLRGELSSQDFGRLNDVYRDISVITLNLEVYRILTCLRRGIPFEVIFQELGVPVPGGSETRGDPVAHILLRA